MGDDHLRHLFTIFKTLDECKAIVPIVTRGSAKSLWCMRELYYVTFNKLTRIYPVVIEDDWKIEGAGAWLNITLKQVEVVNPVNEEKIEEVAQKISKVTSCDFL